MTEIGQKPIFAGEKSWYSGMQSNAGALFDRTQNSMYTLGTKDVPTWKGGRRAPDRGAGINEAPIYTVAPFSRKLNADEFFIKYFFFSLSGD